MAIRNFREVARSAGLAPAASTTIIAGQPLVLATASTVKPYDDTTHADIPYGIAAESTAIPSLAPANGLTAGQGYNYTDFDRGGLVSCFMLGSELELYDDGRGAPYETGDTYVLNRPVYAADNGKVSSSIDTDAKVIGSVVDFEGSPVTRLRIKFTI